MLTSATRWDKLIFICFWIFMKYEMHEKDTTVAWGYHKGVIIDIIIKTIIVHHRFIIYNSSVWWKYLFVFSVKAFRSTLPFMCSNRQSAYWFSLFPYNCRKTQAFFFFFLQIVECHHDRNTVKRLRIVSPSYTHIWDWQIAEGVRGRGGSRVSAGGRPGVNMY